MAQTDRESVGPSVPVDEPACDGATAGASEGGLESIRDILTRPLREEMDVMRHRLDNPPRATAGEVGAVLPEAFELCARESRRIANPMRPIVEATLYSSVERDPETLASALWPALMPAIRKAIAESLKGIVQSLNEALENVFSLRRLRWRVRAWWTGKPIGEIALAENVQFEVREILLVHRKTAIVLQHAAGPSARTEDSDLVAGMLAALEDFARDSFRLDPAEALQSLEVGPVSVLVEQAPSVILAAVVKGEPPLEVRNTLRAELLAIQKQYQEALRSFDGDTSRFDGCRDRLEACLFLEHTERRVRPIFAYMLLATFLGVLLILVGMGYVNSTKTSRYVAALRATPGIHVTDVSRRDGQLIVSGLKDPLASPPHGVLQELGLSREDIVEEWEAFQSGDAPFVLQRARRLLLPPDGVEMVVQDGTLQLSGFAPETWVDRTPERAQLLFGVASVDASALVSTLDYAYAHLEPPEQVTLSIQGETLAATGVAHETWCDTLEGRAKEIPGVRSVDRTQLISILAFARAALSPPDTVNLEVKGDRLAASGIAPREWIRDVWNQRPDIPGIVHYAQEDLKDFETVRTAELKQRIAGATIAFEKRSTTLSPAALDDIDNLAPQLQELAALGVLPTDSAVVRVVGHADSSGTEAINDRLSRDRAIAVRDRLLDKGVPDHLMEVAWVGDDRPLVPETDRQAASQNRAVAFEIVP